MLATSFIYDFAPHCIPDISRTVARRRQPASHAVNALTENNFYRFNAFAQDDDLEGLSRCGDANLDFLVVHSILGTLTSRLSLHYSPVAYF